MRAFLVAAILPLLIWAPALAQTNTPLATLAKSYPAPPIEARSAVLLDAETGKVLASKNAHLHVQIASTTKVMTAVLALQLGHLDDRITVPAGAFNFESDATVMGLKPGETVTLKDLLYGLLLPSGADAANTIAIHYAGSEAKFAALMNKEAAQLGMKDTHYVTAHGLDTPGQYSSAYDLALLGIYASKMPQLMAIAGSRSYNWAGHTLINVNHVLFWYPGVDGIKPGYTYAAGICQLLDARRDGRHVIAAILDTPDLVIDARNLLNFGLRDFTWIQSPLTYDTPGLTVSATDAAGPFAYYIGSGHYLRGNFLKQYWTFARALPLGFPRTEALQVNGHLVQYFQNGELEQVNGKVIRVRLGGNPPPTPQPTPQPTPKPTVKPSATARPGPTGTSISVKQEGTPVPTPHKTPTPVPPVPTPTSVPHPTVASLLNSYVKAHPALGAPVVGAWKVKGFTLQTFRYGALMYDPAAKRVWLLPLGDRLLAGLHYLPKHPGTGYPPDFAPASILHALGWMAG
jgi:D-alanyl-D-alanine carboxypeptidase